ncbi:MAG: PAS domain S-box protein [Chloroflexi bacterium]|nr:PAS domain S-box protein [Chloroflexota bacterium]
MDATSEEATAVEALLRKQLEAAQRRIAELERALAAVRPGEASPPAAQEDALASPAFLRQVIDTNPNIVFVRDGYSRYTLVNRALVELYGLPREQILGSTPSALAERLGLDREQALGFEQRDREVLAGGQRGEWMDRFVDRFGQVRYFQTIIVPMVGESASGERQPRHVLGVCSEVTRQHIIEQALRQSEHDYRNLVENAPIGIFAIDAEGNLTEVNAALLEMPGFESWQPAQGINLLLEPFAVQVGLAADLGYCLDSGKVREAEGHYQREGVDVWFRYHLQPMRGEADEIAGVLALVEDISERKRLERQLQQAAKMEAVGRLAGGIAHDFNNLLTVINGYSEVLLARLTPRDPLYEILLQIRDAGRRAADLTRRLLVFSRREHVEIGRVDLNELLSNMAKILQRVLGEEIELTLHLAEGLPLISADAGQLEQVIMNLSVNARDAILETLAVGERPGVRAGAANGSLVISTGVQELTAETMPTYLRAQPGCFVVLSVRDNGVGMAREVLEHLFEPFFTTKRVGQGTGLGLAIVYSVLHELGGTVDVESEPGLGTTFRLFFPVEKAKAQERPGPGARIAEDRNEAYIPHGSGQILVVEDQDFVRDLTAHMLEEMGYTVITAASGAEALALLHAQPRALQIDLLISDVVMPGMSGPALVQALRAERPGLPVVYVSGYADDMIAARGDLGPGTWLVYKPFGIEQLARVVREALAGQGQRKSS